MLKSNSIKDEIIDHEEFLAIMRKKQQYYNEKSEVDKSKLSEVEVALVDFIFLFLYVQ